MKEHIIEAHHFISFDLEGLLGQIKELEKEDLLFLLDYSDLKTLKSYLKNLLKHKETCEKCGSIIPELNIDLEGKTFHFVCFLIQDRKHNILRQTDYGKLGEKFKFIRERIKKEEGKEQ